MKLLRFRNGDCEYAFDKGDLIGDVDLPIGTPVGICPDCGEELIIRKSKFGKFVGCNGFKNGCRKTYNLKGFRAIRNMNISLIRNKRAGFAGELMKSLYIKD